MTPDLRDEAEKVASDVRAAIVKTYGGMGSSSSIWGQTQYDKGFSTGITVALTAYDHAKVTDALVAFAECQMERARLEGQIEELEKIHKPFAFTQVGDRMWTRLHELRAELATLDKDPAETKSNVGSEKGAI